MADSTPDAAAAHTAAAHAQVKLAASAGALKQSARAQENSADRRTRLAADRTLLAAERTYAAWVRTGLAALAAGVGARPLLDGLAPGWLIGATGSVLILFSAICYAAAVWRDLWPGVPPPRPDARRLPVWLPVGINAFLILVSLAVLVGLWAR